ncbi:TerC family protein [Schinkia sp. CFF1]
MRIYIMNVINDIDNFLIISAIIRKYGYQIRTLFLNIVVCLTLSRTLYVSIIQYLEDIPGFRVITGVILLYIAFRLAFLTPKDCGARNQPNKTIVQMMLIILMTDFTICIDSVLITAELSTNPVFIMIGIFLSITTVFLLLDSFFYILTKSSIIQVIASGLIAHIAILGLLKDPITRIPVILIEDLFEININNWINVFALDISILFIIIGLMKRIKRSKTF